MAAHTPETLVKYCSADSAQKILESQNLRWSAPHLFSDPFELNHETQLNFDPHILLQAATKMASSMVFAKDTPRGNTPLINAIRRWRDEERFASPEEAEEVLKELLSQIVDQRQLLIEHMMTDWRKFARSLRICTFTVKPDNLSAWQYFADRHRGVAIRFQTGEYTLLDKPHKVEYKASRPEISTLRNEMSVIMGGARYTAQEHFLERFTIKATACANEQEWRCFHESKEDVGGPGKPDTQWYDNRRFERSEVKAIYLGAYIPAQQKRDVFKLIRENYSQAKVFQAKVVNGKYDIEFERISKDSSPA